MRFPKWSIVGCVLVCLYVGIGTGVVYAQDPVINPSVVEFQPSPDHAAMLLGTTTPKVTRYDLELYIQGAAQPFQVTDVGKPNPDAGGLIRLTNRAWFIGAALDTLCVARMVAVGPSGIGRSEVSNPFGNAGPPAAPGAPVVRSPGGTDGSGG